MQELLITKLHGYITQNNPDLLLALQQEENVTRYLEEKVAGIENLFEQLQAANMPPYLIEERCMEALTQDLRPSKFNYLVTVIEEEFEPDYYRLKESGTLTYEVINMISACTPVFEAFGFTKDNEDDRHLRYAITGAIKEYLEN